jgi:NAD(P)-dependent dehydrogenase (short-subunit alcohol dehydrogenase family)
MTTAARPGRIITISSSCHSSARVRGAYYCASKATIVMSTNVLAMELTEQCINVNCIAPNALTASQTVRR